MNYILTGLLCSGKSTFLEVARTYDFETLSADNVVDDLYKNRSVISKIQDKFKDYDLFDNTKEVIRMLFFKSKKNRKKIESLIHPEVHRIINEKLLNKKNLIVEVPPLMNNYRLLKENKSIFIDTDMKNRTIRYLKRDNKNEILTFERLNNMQLDYMELKMVCDLIIDNNDKESFNKYFELEIIKK